MPYRQFYTVTFTKKAYKDLFAVMKNILQWIIYFLCNGFFGEFFTVDWLNYSN